MGQIADVRAGLKTAITAITGLRVHSRWPNTVNPPALIITAGKDGLTEQTTFDGRGSLHFDLVLILGAQDVERAQEALDEYCDFTGSKSIRAKVETDTTLGGVCEDLDVGEWKDYGELEVAGVPYMGAALPVEVYVTF